MSQTSSVPRRQRGAALLLIMLGIIAATATVLLLNLNRDDLRTRQLEQTQSILATAREALIDYALLNPDHNPGEPYSLPCPDIDTSGGFADGEAHTTACGAAGVSMIGRLPWRTLGLPALKDTSSACLWYVVSGTWKNAGSATATMINADSNGQLQLYDIERAAITEGVAADDRPVAMVIAPMQALATQTRPGALAGVDCVPGANPGNYLDADAGSGISNAALGGVVDGVDVLAIVAGARDDHNDRIVSVSRSDIERRLVRRADFRDNMRSLGLAAAACIANYGASNPGGASDKRLPWPATFALTDYRLDANYDDANNGFYSGRLPDIADDSNASTGNSIARILSDCDASLVPGWTAIQMARWQHWKDHFYYAVGEAFSPSATTPSNCGNCLTINGSGQYAAALLFANSRLAGQVRDAPPTDTDTKRIPGNYLEGLNASNIPGPATARNFESGASSAVFNDLLFCIDDQLVVSEC
ncbi:MAG TPA: hypothetical protein PKH39_05980 [Woeseiaceae bacterium]|nr:hypothetical protein [Woeseiaceae bacterium]